MDRKIIGRLGSLLSLQLQEATLNNTCQQGSSPEYEIIFAELRERVGFSRRSGIMQRFGVTLIFETLLLPPLP